MICLAEGLFFTVAWGKRSAALGLRTIPPRLAEGLIHLDNRVIMAFSQEFFLESGFLGLHYVCPRLR